MSIQPLASAVDTALSALASAIEALAVQADAKDRLWRASHHGHPSPEYEDIGRKIRAAVASNATLRAYLRFEAHNPPTKLAALFPPSD